MRMRGAGMDLWAGVDGLSNGAVGAPSDDMETCKWIMRVVGPVQIPQRMMGAQWSLCAVRCVCSGSRGVMR